MVTTFWKDVAGWVFQEIGVEKTRISLENAQAAISGAVRTGICFCGTQVAVGVVN